MASAEFEEDGMFELKLGDKPPKMLDLLRCNNQIVAVQMKYPDDGGDSLALRNDALVDLVASWGFDAPSYRTMFRVTDRIIAEAAAAMGKDGPAQNPSSIPD